ncbi:CLIP-associating protein 1 [Trichinella nelsoni]|uniref:CLIP-associating protein 1 n=1 Tax=Trichinella nelsoni TaxID=6336 RepID=A0A0V0RMG4_9BILA|nr:CLIP-associating protein 1 [Trichinella nelsoni]
MAYGILQVKSKYCGLVGRSFSIQTLMTMARPVVSTRKSPGAVVQADFESEFENVEILPTTFDKPASVVENIFNEIDERGNWIKRCNAIKKLRSAMLSAELSILILSDIPKLARKLNSCFTDLRSQIVRETCVTFAFIAQLEKSKCERLAEFCLPTMLDLVNASAKVISSSASVASTIMFKHVQSFRLIAVLVDKYNSKSRDIRRLCASLMRFSLQTWNDANLKKIPKTQVANFITNILDDADQKVRADGQEVVYEQQLGTAFALLYKFDEEMAIGVMKRFTGARRRQIEAIVTSLRNKAAQGERTPVTPKRVTALKPSALPVLIANHSPARTPLPKRTSVKSHFCKPVRSDHKPTLPTDVKLAEKQDLKIESKFYNYYSRLQLQLIVCIREVETEMENNPIPRDSCLLETSNESDNVELLQDVQKDVHPPLKLREMLASLNEMNKVDQMTTILEPVDMELETIGEPTEESSSVEEITGKCPKPVIKLSSPFDENLSSDHEPLLEKGNIETSGQNKDGSTTLKNEAFIFDLTTNKLQVLQLDSSEQEEHVQMKFDENSSSVEIDLIQFSSVDESEKCSDLISLSSVQENSPKLSMSDRRITLSKVGAFFEQLIGDCQFHLFVGEQLSSMNTSILKKQTASLKSDGDTVGQSTVSTSSPDAFRVSNDVQCDIDNQRATRDVNLDETAIEDSNLLKDTESVRAQYRGTFEDDLVQMDIIMEICKQFPIPEADIVIQSIDSWPKLVSLYCQGNKETKPIVIFALEHLFNANQHLPLAGNVHTVRFLRALLEDIFSYKDDDADDSITLLLLINEKQPIETLKTIAIDGKFSDHLIKLLDDIINVFNLPEC